MRKLSHRSACRVSVWPHQLEGRPANRRYGARFGVHPAVPAIAELDQPASEGILIVELDGWHCGALASRLESVGYRPRVVQGVSAALKSGELQPVSLCIMGGSADFADCYRLRRALSAPLFVLLQQNDGEQALAMLYAGADDCQANTIGHEEVVARVRVLLRRRAAASPAARSGTSRGRGALL